MAVRDFTANQIRTAKIIMTGSSPSGGVDHKKLELSVYSESVAPDQLGGNPAAPTYTNVGNDISIFVSGSQTARSGVNGGGVLFQGDTYISGTLVVKDAGRNAGGSISGSIHHTSDGNSYMIAGTGIAIASGSNGQVTITSTISTDVLESLHYYDEYNGTPDLDPNASGVHAVAIGDGAHAAGSDSLVFGNNVTGSGHHATIFGGINNVIEETLAGYNRKNAIFGGQSNLISGSSLSVIAGGFKNHISGTAGSPAGSDNSGIFGGYENKLSGSYSNILGGFRNKTEQNYATVIGQSLTSSNTGEVVIGFGSTYDGGGLNRTIVSGSNFIVAASNISVFNEDGATADFRVEGSSAAIPKKGAILVDGGTNQVVIQGGGVSAAASYGLNAATTTLPADISTFISGACGATGKLPATSGVTVIAGDLVVSGTIFQKPCFIAEGTTTTDLQELFVIGDPDQQNASRRVTDGVAFNSRDIAVKTVRRFGDSTTFVVEGDQVVKGELRGSSPLKIGASGSNDALIVSGNVEIVAASGSNVGANLSISGSMTVTGSMTVSGSNTFTVYGPSIFNADQNANNDFQVKSATNANMLYVDSSTDRVGVGIAAPLTTVHVKKASGENELRLQSSNKFTSIIQKDNAELIIQNASAGPVIFYDDSAETMRIAQGGTVTLAGDLIVKGATTTVSSSNLVIQDSIIGLGFSGSSDAGAIFNNVGDRAIIFGRGAAASSALPAINYDGSNSNIEFATFIASPSSGSMGAPQTFIDLSTGNINATGFVKASMGLSGSLTRLTDGKSYLVAGSNVTIASASNGQVTVSVDDSSVDTQNTLDQAYDEGGTAAGAKIIVDGQPVQFEVAGSSKTAFAVTGSVFIGSGSIIIPGPDANFFVSGTIGSKGTSNAGTSVFGGDVVISGTLHGGSPLTIGSDILPAADDTHDIGSATAAWQDLFLEGDLTFTDAGKIVTTAGDLTIEAEAANAKVLIKGDNESGIAIHLDGNAAAASEVQIDAGILDIDVTAGITIDGTTISIDGTDDVNLTVTSSGDGEDLTIQQVGANDSSIHVLAAGTGTDAIKIDATAGDMLIAPTLIDGKTLKIGPTSATEMVFTPHGTPASEKISITNTSGTADDAIKIESTAGGITILAGNDSLIIDADGTDADAINIDSAGGIDVDAVGDIAINTTGRVILSGSSADDSVLITSDFQIDGKSFIKDDVQLDVNKKIYFDGNSINNGPFIYGNTTTLHVDGDNFLNLYFDDRAQFLDNNSKTALLLNNEQVLIMSGGAPGSTNEGLYPDVALFVSGAIGSRGTSTKGVALFGGDVVISGTLHGASSLDVGSDINLIFDGSKLAFGVNNEITLTHVHDAGLTITNTIAGTDNKPVVLQLKSEEDVIVAEDVIASIEFAAGDSDGTDGADVSAGIHAIAENTFGADANATKLVFTTAVQESANSAATAKMTLDSGGNLKLAGELQTANIGFTDGDNAIVIANGGGITAAAGITSIAASNLLGATSFNDADITNVGDLNCDSLSVDDAAVGLDIQFGGNTTLNKLTLTDNLADALNITEAGNSYIKFITTNSSEAVVVAKKLEVSSGIIDVTNATENSILIPDDKGDALVIKEGSNLYAKFATTDGSELVTLFKDVLIQDDKKLLFGTNSDAYIEYDEDGSDSLVAHVPAAGFSIMGIPTADDKPVRLNLLSSEAALIADEVVGQIDFQAIGETGTDATEVCASIQAIAEAEFDASNNQTKLAFFTAKSEDATSVAAKLEINHRGSVTMNAGTTTAGGNGFDGGEDGAPTADVQEINNEVVTTFKINIDNMVSTAGSGARIIGDSASAANAYFARLNSAVNGFIYKAEMICVETPTTGEPDLDLYAKADIQPEGGGVAGDFAKLIDADGDWFVSKFKETISPFPGSSDPAFTHGLHNYYLYLANGNGGTSDAGTYGAGKWLVRLYGVKTFGT